MTQKRLQWGIIGTGQIAKELADGVRASNTGALLAVASREQKTSDAFGEAYGAPRRYGSYQRLLDDPDVQAVYIATPHPMHAEWAVKAAEAGKHILVEKPIGLNAPEARAMIDAAAKHDVFLMEAFMYRCHPQTAKLVELIRGGAIGQVRLIRASFCYFAPFDAANRAYNNDLAGGGILDVGCYPVSASRLIAGAAHSQPFLNPLDVKGVAHLGQTGVDEYAAAVLRFSGNIVAEVSTGIGLNMHETQTIEVFGTDGRLFVADPWCPSRWNRDPLKIVLKRHDEKVPQEILVACPRDLYTCEADMVADHISERQAPAMPWDDTLGNMETLDRWRQEVGLIYEQEQPAHYTSTITRRTLQRNPDAPMTYGRIAGLNKDVSRLVQGADSNHTMPYTALQFDEYFACGGNAFDTSHGYGNPNGACERNLGQWIRNRGIRDQVVIIEKGANPPNGTPEGLTQELLSGLERLQTDHVDIWMMHRDNPAVPVGEFIDVLNEHQAAGRCTIFGVSNWSLERLRKAHAYAKRQGKTFFSVLSNQFSLAEMIDNPWPEVLCLSARDPAFRRWLKQTQMPLLPWSSQARGFFTDRAGRDRRDDSEIVRCWYSEANFLRRDRTYELAARKNVEPINIALAWVLHQPFPTFPLVGPRRHREIWSCLQALSVELSPGEIKWLEGASPIPSAGVDRRGGTSHD